MRPRQVRINHLLYNPNPNVVDLRSSSSSFQIAVCSSATRSLDARGKSGAPFRLMETEPAPNLFIASLDQECSTQTTCGGKSESSIIYLSNS